MPKLNEPTPRDLDIIANATRYSVTHGRERHTFEDRAEAVAKAEELAATGTRGSLLYAVGITCGVEASALMGTFLPPRVRK